MSLSSINLFVVALLCAIIGVIAVPVPLEVVDNVLSVAEDALSSDYFTTWSYTKLESLFESTSAEVSETPSSSAEEVSSEEVEVPTPEYSTPEEATSSTPDYSTTEDATTDTVPRCPYH
ncbi:hypothetical protein H4R20_005914 [Coemansia guatemalensis]|uniref:Uncharacterized protein n=1 Tax=Coemansia guatemalensis TaxID=2761395 RepID=A0A9W8HRV1_9FUNG|nr:hypothetical protein H4R20_005914 [Coemansia guatemalensis]